MSFTKFTSSICRRRMKQLVKLLLGEPTDAKDPTKGVLLK
jgi:hypothetical protein